MKKKLHAKLTATCRRTAHSVTALLKQYALLLIFLFSTIFSFAQGLQPQAIKQIESLAREKASRTPAQKKINSQILYAIKMQRGEAITAEVPKLRTSLVKLNARKLKVDIKANVSTQVLTSLRNAGAEINFSSERFKRILANIPLNKIEEIAANAGITSIDLWLEPTHNDGREHKPENNNNSQNADFTKRADNIRKQLNNYFIGSVTSQADKTHRAEEARSFFNTTGAGVKIGVLSDGVTGYATSQASGDLPPVINILPGQEGSGSEGRAMMELIYDLAPGADLYFATAFTSAASFAQNILDLRAAGCDIIVDDITYYAEAVFQDGPIAQAVNTVTADGALYFSSAGNSGNKNDNTAGVWEGDFVDGGDATGILTGAGRLHSYGGVLYNAATATTGYLSLKWADPLGQSNNDYDIYLTDAAGTTIWEASTNPQDGDDDPYEICGNAFTGEKIYIVKYSGETRALHLNSNRGRLTFTTPGVMYGHNAAGSAYTVAATPAATRFYSGFPMGPYPNPFNSTNVVEGFSSDGPRRIFYYPDGSAITPGNILFSTNGGTVLQKPDITAADGTSTATPGFNTFYGTSAAAPHAAAIAALIKSKIPSLTPEQIRAALINTAIDIEEPGFDRDAGHGIIMAYEALASLAPTASVLSINGSSEICAGGTTNLIVDITGGTGPYTVVYTDGTDNYTVDNYVSGTDIPVTPAGNITYTLVSVTDANDMPGANNSGTATVTVSSTVTWYRDADGDGYGDPNNTIDDCEQPAGYIDNNEDCNDNNATVYPGAPELCDGIDNNCNGTTDEGCTVSNIKVGILDKARYETNKGVKPLKFKVQLNKKPTQTVQVDYTTENLTATAGQDYVAQSGTLTFAPGVKKQIITIEILGDKVIESDETFRVVLSNPVNASIAINPAIGTILNDDGSAKAIQSASPIADNIVKGQSVAKVYPNPAKDVVNIQLQGFKGVVTIQVSDIAGRLLKQVNTQAFDGKYLQHRLDLSGLNNGVYLIKIIDSNGKITTEKVLLQR